jgi:glycosyltransferase involved in cell wall biosynthesis
VIFHNGLSDADYIKLLDSAALVVSASRAEGFGIPVIEGFARGVPAVLTDIPVFREIAEDGAVYFAEGDWNSCAEAIAQAIENREGLSASAVRRSSEFSWAESARNLAAVIESLS